MPILLILALLPKRNNRNMNRQDTVHVSPSCAPTDRADTKENNEKNPPQATHRIIHASNVITQVTAQLSPLQDLEIPINLRTIRVSQKTGSMQFRMRLAFRLFHLAN